MNTPPPDNHILWDKEKVIAATTSTSECRKKILFLQGDDARKALTWLQEELDVGRKTDRHVIIKVMTHLAGESNQLPANIWLKDLDYDCEPFAEGALACVYRGFWNKLEVALKVQHQNPAGLDKKFCREVLLWRQLKHENILPFMGLYQLPDRSGIAKVSRWKSRGNLMDYIRNVRSDRFKPLLGIAAGLTYLHEHEPVAVHGNLKPENILVNYDGKALLADFGSSRAQLELSDVNSTTTDTSGTYRYMSPELLVDPGKQTTFSDIWAFGMIVYVTFTGDRPFAELNKGQTIMAIQRGQKPQLPTFLATQRGLTSELWSYLEEFCWAKEPNERTLARNCRISLKAFEDRWLENVDMVSPREVIEVLQAPPTYIEQSDALRSLEKQFGVRIMKQGTDGLKIMGREYNVATTLTHIRRDPQFSVKPPAAVVEHHIIPTRLHSRLLASSIIDEIRAELSVTIKFEPNTAILEGTHNNIQEAVSRLGTTVEKLKRRSSEFETPFNQIFRGSYLRPDISHSANSAADSARASVLRNEVPDPPLCPEPIPPRPDKKPDRRPSVSDKEPPNLAPRDVASRRKSQPQLKPPQPETLLFGMHIHNDLHEELLRGEYIQQLEIRTNTRIYFPRHILHGTFSIPENRADLHLVNPEDLVYIQGTREDCAISRRELETAVSKLDASLHQIARFGAKYHHEVYELVHEELWRMGIQVDFSRNASLHRLSRTPILPMILPQLKSNEYAWSVVRRFDLHDCEDCTWHLRAKSAEVLQAGFQMICKAVQTVSAASYMGRLFFHKSHVFPPMLDDIKKKVLQRLQRDFRVKILLPPDEGDNNIVRIIGSKKMVEASREDVVKFLETNWMKMLDLQNP